MVKKIQKRTFEKSLWNYSTKVITYFPAFNKNQRGIKQILINARNTSKICSRCRSYGEINRKEFFCNKCGLINNSHINASKNISKRTIEILKNQ